jgi:hypothetical protein
LCILAAVAVDVLCFGGGGERGAQAAATTHYPLPGITGALELRGHGTESLGRAAASVGGPCKGLGTFNDLLGGAPVVVTDQNGTTIATSALDIGKVADSSTCEFAFFVPDVPKAESYRFAVGGRPVLDVAYDDLSAQGWQVTLALG